MTLQERRLPSGTSLSADKVNKSTVAHTQHMQQRLSGKNLVSNSIDAFVPLSESDLS